MDDFVQSTHPLRLTDQIRESTLSLEEAERQVLKYVQRFVEVEGPRRWRATPSAGSPLIAVRRSWTNSCTTA